MHNGTRSISADPVGIVSDPAAGIDSGVRVRALLERMKQGDRHAVALFMLENGDLIRRRFRGRISRSVRRLFDSQDLVSTLTRRLDRIVYRGTLGAGSVGQFWSLVMVLGSNSLSEHVRRARRRDSRDPENIDHVECSTERSAPNAGCDAEDHSISLLDRCLTRLDDNVDATILVLKLGGCSHAHIATHLGMSVEAIRKRWERIRRSLRDLENEPWVSD